MATPDSKTVDPAAAARVLLTQVPGLGRDLVWNLLDTVDEPIHLFDSPDQVDQLSIEGIGSSRGATLREHLEKWDPEQAAARLEGQDIGLLTEDSLPDPLTSVTDAPVGLFYRGEREMLDKPCVAVVGTRKADPQGKEIARDLGRGLANNGVTVISGLAAGIDGEAHQGALDADGPTAAVLGNGLNEFYPARNRSLQNQIVQEGLVLSEYPPDQSPTRQTFPERNRIISGLSQAVVVVQAGERSGALITADFALEQGRDVYAVPGNVGNSRHDGCHMLLKQGAGLVESAEDLLDYLQLEGHYVPEERRVEVGPAAATVLEKLDEQPSHVDELVSRTDYNLGTVSQALIELEDAGLVLPVPGQRYQRKRDARHAEVRVLEGEEENDD